MVLGRAGFLLRTDRSFAAVAGRRMARASACALPRSELPWPPMPPRKPTPPPKTPALVRTGVAAFVVGLGLTGAACGDEIVTGDGGDPLPFPPAPTPAGGGDGSASDDVFDDGTTGSDVIEGGVSPTPIFPPAPPQPDSSFEDRPIPLPPPPPHP